MEPTLDGIGLHFRTHFSSVCVCMYYYSAIEDHKFKVFLNFMGKARCPQGRENLLYPQFFLGMISQLVIGLHITILLLLFFFFIINLTY
jgi:hypothetical protein